MINQYVSIDAKLLRQLLQAGKAGRLVARGIPGGFILSMTEGLGDQVLEAQRGHPRKFKRLDAVASFLQGIGGSEFHVDLAQWSVKSLSI